MTRKIPVGSTIAQAYRFAFGRLGAAIGVMWLPLALVFAAAYLLFRDVAPPPGAPADAHEAFLNWTRFYVSLVGPFRWFELVLWVAAVTIEVGLVTVALGVGRTPVVYFNLGAPFWRMLGARLIATVLVGLAAVPLIVVAVALGATAGALGQDATVQSWIDPEARPWIAAGFVLLFTAGILALFYIYIRLWFLLAPVVVAERHIDIRRSWHLAKGNVARIVVIMLAVFVPVVLVAAPAEFFAVYLMLAHSFSALPDARFFRDNAIAYAVIGAVLLFVWIVGSALWQGARAAAYRALEPPPSAPAA